MSPIQAPVAIMRCLVVQDGVTSQPYAYVDTRSLRFAPDGRLSYVARKAERGYQMVLAGQHGPELSVVTPMVFSASGGHWGYIGERDIPYRIDTRNWGCFSWCFERRSCLGNWNGLDTRDRRHQASHEVSNANKRRT